MSESILYLYSGKNKIYVTARYFVFVYYLPIRYSKDIENVCKLTLNLSSKTIRHEKFNLRFKKQKNILDFVHPNHVFSQGDPNVKFFTLSKGVIFEEILPRWEKSYGEGGEYDDLIMPEVINKYNDIAKLVRKDYDRLNAEAYIRSVIE